jgi:hypothetical protein
MTMSAPRPLRAPYHRPWRRLALAALVAGLALPAPLAAQGSRSQAAQDDPASRHLYATGGVHNDVGCIPPAKCVYTRKAGEPTDPLYPAWWSSHWDMYRVFQNYDKFPPPYANPPEGLTPDDYQKSSGATYYDSTYVPRDKDGRGAMMEHYEKFCLPIFPMANTYTCSFVSLGNKAYFLRYDDRPPGTPQCCQFSLKNHPPRRNFIKHLPYNPQDSTHLNGTIQGYSYVVQPNPPGILFGYAFYKEATPDSADAKAKPYRHPQSFYFSGYYTGDPNDPPNAPIVSQNYTDFSMRKPDPKETWDQVARMCPAKPEWCCLFSTDCPAPQAQTQQSPRPAEAPTPANMSVPPKEWSRARPEQAARPERAR